MTAPLIREMEVPTLQRHPLPKSRRREADGWTTAQRQPSEPRSVAELQQPCKQTFRSRGFALLPKDRAILPVATKSDDAFSAELATARSAMRH